MTEGVNMEKHALFLASALRSCTCTCPADAAGLREVLVREAGRRCWIALMSLIVGCSFPAGYCSACGYSNCVHVGRRAWTGELSGPAYAYLFWTWWWSKRRGCKGATGYWGCEALAVQKLAYQGSKYPRDS